jgi:tRNA modification GTPase
VSFGGVTLRISDTAGIHDTGDTVEKMGVTRAEDEIERAELVIAVFDGSRTPDSEDESLIERLRGVSVPVIAVINKSDLPSSVSADWIGDIENLASRVVYASARAEDADRSGRDELACAVREITGAGEFDLSTDAVIWDVRQREMLLHARASLASAVESIELGGPIDAVCTLAEEALAALNETDGRGVGEEIVSEIFKRFCVGK